MWIYRTKYVTLNNKINSLLTEQCVVRCPPIGTCKSHNLYRPFFRFVYLQLCTRLHIAYAVVILTLFRAIILWRVPLFPKYHQTSFTFYRDEFSLRQCIKPDIYCYLKFNFSSASIKLTCQPVIIDTSSQCHLHNELAMHSRYDTIQSVPSNKAITPS